MRGPRSLEDFAALARVSPAEVERYRDAGLLDSDQDGLYDEIDALRLQFIMVQLAMGHTLEDLVTGIEEGAEEFAAFGGLLFSKGKRAYTVDEAAEAVGLSAERIQELRTASGLPGAWIHEMDLDTFRAVRQMLDAGLPWEALIEGGRVWGDAMRRIAEVEMRLAHRYLHEPLAAAGVDDAEIVKMHFMTSNLLGPLIDPLLKYVHEQYALRSQVEDVLLHLESVARPSVPGSMEATILFVDLSSFTALAQVHGDEVAAEVLDRFDGLVRSLVHPHHGTLVKQIGDAFMLTFAEPADSVAFALELDAGAAREEHFPSMRMGIHAGQVLYRVGDYVGTTVNVASRIAGAAMPNEIVMTEPVAVAAKEAGIEVGALGVRMLRGIEEPLTLYRVIKGKERREFRDPVCGMTVLEDAAARLTWGGVDYAFCSEDCLRRFVAAPDRYTAARAGSGRAAEGARAAN